MLIATRSFTAADGPKPSRRERRFWAETESLRHPREAADPIHDLSALDAEAERAALAEVDEVWGAAAPWQNWRGAPRGTLQWAQMCANADFALSEAPDRAQTPASERA